MFGVFGVSMGLLVALIVFGRRAERAAYGQVEGQPGAAAAGLSMLRRGWSIQNAVAVTKNQDLVHRVVGRPGIILIGEGNPTRVRNLLAVEKKKHARFAADAPIYDITAGRGDGGQHRDQQAVTAHHEAPQEPQAGRGDRAAPAAQGARRVPARRADTPRAGPPNAKAARQALRGGR